MTVSQPLFYCYIGWLVVWLVGWLVGWFVRSFVRSLGLKGTFSTGLVGSIVSIVDHSFDISRNTKSTAKKIKQTSDTEPK